MNVARRTVDIVVPVHNEEACLERTVRRVHAELQRMPSFVGRIIVADNGSSDSTPLIAKRLSRQLAHVMLLRIDQRGRGRALRNAWMSSNADIVVYMDVDLSTDLSALPVLVEVLASGKADIAIGSRLIPGARVRRSLRREIISRCYNFLLRRSLGVRFHDAQCGFKGMRSGVARRLVPLVKDEHWFLDTELLVTAERAGATVLEVPVTWVENPRSSVHIVGTALQDLRGILRMRRLAPAEGRRSPVLVDQLMRFAAIGVVSTVAYVALFDMLRATAPAEIANAIALAVTAVANSVANRRYTFGIRGPAGRLRTLLAGAATFALALTLTAAALAGLRAADSGASALTTDAVLVVTSAVATVMRFGVLRSFQKLQP